MTQTNKKAFNIMAFPAGPICNVRCDYCYYLDKTELYPDTEDFNMSEELLEEYIKQYIDSQPGPRISFGWQGGEPTLRGLDFFKKAVSLIEKYIPENWQYDISFQTNGILIDDDWAEFMAENDFLVGLSIDGPAEFHDAYRKDKGGAPTHKKVMRGLDYLKKHDVQYNILCVVNKVNSTHPVEVYDFFKEQGAEHIQFIPIVEQQEEGEISERSVTPEEYGRFLIGVFDRWLFDGYGEIYVQIFEQCVSAWAGYGTSLCVFNETCGLAAVLEHNGDLYSCDHFVLPEYKLGNIKEKSIAELMSSSQQIQFGEDKRDTLSDKCLNCDYLFICHGGCPKNRVKTLENGKKINFLCEGYKRFFEYIDPYMEEIVKRINQQQSPPTVKKHLQKIHDSIWKKAGRNDPCPCGSGKKFKKCCIDRK
ncbi:MAG: anaerobic sulfatase maturase [Halanaerobiaceae bacterium]